MNRSTGVTVSAVLVFIGSGLTVVFGGLFGFVTLLVPKGPAQPPFVRYVLAFSIVMYAAFGIWGIASGIGLLRLRQWARISVLVFSGILLFFTVPMLIMLPFLPMPRLEGSGNIVLAIKLGMSFFYGTIAAIGGGWLYFFNRRSVKEQFRRQPEAVLLTSAEAIIPASSPSRRPLSIGIIGWILAVGSCFALPIGIVSPPHVYSGFPVDWMAGELNHADLVRGARRSRGGAAQASILGANTRNLSIFVRPTKLYCPGLGARCSCSIRASKRRNAV